MGAKVRKTTSKTEKKNGMPRQGIFQAK